MKYVIQDLENGDIVYMGDDIKEAKKAYDSYNEECDGEWIPIFDGVNEAELIRGCWL